MEGLFLLEFELEEGVLLFEVGELGVLGFVGSEVVFQGLLEGLFGTAVIGYLLLEVLAFYLILLPCWGLTRLLEGHVGLLSH